MVSGATSILLANKGEFESVAAGNGVAVASQPSSSPNARAPSKREQFLRIPPFPGARTASFVSDARSDVDAALMLAVLRRLRVGGTYWAAQPMLPSDYVLVRSIHFLEGASRTFPSRPIVLWTDQSHGRSPAGALIVRGECDPWHMLARAVALLADEGDEVCDIAAILGVTCYEIHGDKAVPRAHDALQVAKDLAQTRFRNPFFGSPMDAIEAAELCGFWRQLIDSNRNLAGGLGFAFWKQDHVAPLLWGGAAPFKFLRGVDEIDGSHAVAAWRAKAAPALLAELERTASEVVEVEDGFLRSRGLGADCIPPLSITVDRLGAHFDPKQPSELEWLLQNGVFDAATIDRARELRGLIVEAGIGKYERATALIERPAGTRRHILVPGQVEDDRAVTAGGCGLTSNLELLKRVREQAPDAFILYKPHPDVLAGHRRGAISETTCLRYADKIVGEFPIAAVIGMVDEVHVNTSLAGFEALLRNKEVTTYGVPFYAGWGLTKDLGSVPARRTARRNLDELVAATLLLYPRYLDPITRLPCPAEVVVARLTAEDQRKLSLLVGMRRLQGKLMRRLRSIMQ